MTSFEPVRAAAMLMVFVVGASLVLASCTKGSDPVSGSTTDEAFESPVEMVAMPPKFARKCRSEAPLAPACPARVPRSNPRSLNRPYARKDGPDKFLRKTYLFDLSYEAPTARLSRRSAPPDVLHMYVISSPDLDHLFGAFKWPTELVGEPTVRPPKERRQPMLLDRPTWAGRSGELVLAPAYPFGGMNGEHLIFRWSEDETEYAITLHSWLPFTETIGTLRAIVESVP